MLRAMLLLAFAPSCTPVCPKGDCPTDVDRIDRGDGWDAPWGSGRIYAIASIAIADDVIGFDLDGRCLGGTCVDNRLSALALLNDQIRQEHLAGNGRTIMELAGADTLVGDDPRATVKTYEAVDFTQPAFAADDFVQCEGCGRFYITERSLLGENARSRAPAKIEEGVVRNAGIASLAFTLPLLQQTRVLVLEHVAFEVKQISEVEMEVLLAGAVAASELGMILQSGCLGAACRTTLLDQLVSLEVQPDIDVDGDGLESFSFDPSEGRVVGCYDGCVEGCPHDLSIAPEIVDEPWTCAFAREVKDAYSVTFILAATSAFIQGVR